MSARPSDGHRRGVVLPVVLILIALVAALGLSFTSRSQVESLVMTNTAEVVRARALAEAGIYRAAADLLRRSGHGAAAVYEDPVDFEFAGATISVLATNETGKVDLNAAPDAILRRLLEVLEFDDDELDRLVDAIVDWRDEDDLARLNGAEADRYASEGLSYGPANRAFLTLEEIDQVLGFERGALNKIRPLATVWSAQAKIYPPAAPDDVLRAIPGLSSDLVESYIEARAANISDRKSGGGLSATEAPQPLPALVGADDWVATRPAPLYRIVSHARASERGVAVLEAIVRIGGGGPGGHEVLWMQDVDASAAHWIEDDAAEDETP